MKNLTKMNILKLIGAILLTSSLTQGTAWAESDGVGTHGGNAVVCFSDPKIAEALTQEGKNVSKTIPDEDLPFITSIEALDLYEARTGIYGETSKTTLEMNTGETEEQFVDRVSHRFDGWIDYKSQENSDHYGQVIRDGKTRINRVVHVDNANMIPSGDISPITKADKGCVYATIAKQTNIGFSEKTELVIDDRLFLRKQNLPLSRAVLLLHEYTLASLGTPDGTTDAVRAVVATFITKTVNLVEIADILGESKKHSESFYLKNLENLVEALGKTQIAPSSDTGYSRGNAEFTFCMKNSKSLPRQIRRGIEVYNGPYSDNSFCSVFSFGDNEGELITYFRRRLQLDKSDNLQAFHRFVAETQSAGLNASTKAKEERTAQITAFIAAHDAENRAILQSGMDTLKSISMPDAIRARIFQTLQNWDYNRVGISMGSFLASPSEIYGK